MDEQNYKQSTKKQTLSQIEFFLKFIVHLVRNRTQDLRLGK